MKEQDQGEQHVRKRYMRLVPAEDGEPVGARVYCDADHPDADQCIVEVGDQRFDFDRSTFDRKFWDPNLARLERALALVYERGRADQRQTIRDALGLPNNRGGDMHGRSGR